MDFPEIRVLRSTRSGLVEHVQWWPRSQQRPDRPAFELTDCGIVEVESVITPDGLPKVKVTFEARLVEVEEE